ncbi:MAG: selenide, water dikinase SelD [Balneolales bacterium]|nr:selenide, water dikinase SelD [Balneolales bacterium]
MNMSDIKLTQYSHGAGCGCKISPGVLSKILNKADHQSSFPNLLVGNDSNDDAAVFDLGNGEAIISTTDFFMPIVDDPSDFGGIASVNALSDIYAMGGTPLMAIAILGWPIDKLPPEVAGEVLNGARKVCKEAGIPLAGGHSIDCPEPIFGLAVTGRIPVENVKRNTGAKPGDLLYLTKELGVGIIATSQKKGISRPEHLEIAKKSMLTLNKIGIKLSTLSYVNALTDVTGFGLLGHLAEVCEHSGVSAKIRFSDVPRMPFIDEYLAQKCIPGGTFRNLDSYGHQIDGFPDNQLHLLADPQTSGGLLISVSPDSAESFEKFMHENGFPLKSFGEIVGKGEFLVMSMG